MIADVPSSILRKLIGHIFDGGWGDSFTTLKDHVLKRPMDPLGQNSKTHPMDRCGLTRSLTESKYEPNCLRSVHAQDEPW